MNLNIRILLPCLFIFLSGRLLAQAPYDEYLKLQSAEKAIIYKKNHVRLQQVRMVHNNVDSFSSISFIDTSGYILLSQNTERKEYLQYDAKGRLTDRLDSFLNKKKKGTAQEFTARYDPNTGKIFYLRTPFFESRFAFTNIRSELQEKCLTKLGNEIHNYHYDVKGRMTEAIFYNEKGKLVKEHKYFYDDGGHLTKETVTDFLPNDTRELTAASYEYNDKGLMSGKNVVIVSNYGSDEAEVKGYFHNPAYYNQNYTYEYDKEGRLIKEKRNDSKLAQFGYTIERFYSENGLIAREDFYDYQGRPYYSLMYTYDYWEKPKKK